jgi:hypothetical protein
MITMRRRGVEVFEIDIALGCLLGFYLGNGIQANSGRAYTWCPFWGQMGITTARVTSITRANNYYSQVSNSRDLWQSNQRAQGMGHNEPQGENGKSNASTATTASRIRTSTSIAQNASMGITSKNVQKGAVERPGCPRSPSDKKAQHEKSKDVSCPFGGGDRAQWRFAKVGITRLAGCSDGHWSPEAP